ncbi:hypothetical protein [Pseudogemmobacter bohemicus]|uniref:hypothetical protein n=1 Tax=Pseudogemmobacter bohemicus TaxID=2250708 RepID=UPI000DD4EC9C|nr:hypothetical protein [Pseudogemmobacter bohemicus]
MRSRGFSLFAAAFLACIVLSVTAQAKDQAKDLVLICDLKVTKRSFSASPLVISLKQDGKEAAVYDPLIYSIYGEPIPAGRKADDSGAVLDWVVKNYRDPATGRRANFAYSAKWNRAKGTISVRSHAQGYDNKPSVVYGSCREEAAPKAKPGKKG